MKSTYRIGAAGAAVIAALTLASAAQAAPVTAQATARAEIVQALTVTNTADLDFGSIALSGVAGTVVVDTNGAATCTNVTCYGTTSAASFDVTGSFNKTLTVSIPVTTTLGNGTDTIALNNYTTSAAAVAGETYYTMVLDGSGLGTFSVGGTLNLQGTESEGTYTGTFDVAVDYL